MHGYDLHQILQLGKNKILVVGTYYVKDFIDNLGFGEQ